MIPKPRFPQLPDNAIDTLLSSVYGNPVAMVNFARTLLVESDQLERAREVCRQALALAPDNAEARVLARPILANGVGSWYFTMVLDEQRHAIYDRVLRKALAGGGTVLDIGAGTGVFAMMAARAGATRVIACERDPVVAQAAKEIVAINGYSDVVTVLAIDSRDLQLGGDLPERADVLLWDNLANNFLGAGCAATLDDAKARLVKQSAAVIPAGAELVVAAVTDLEREERHMGMACGFDMTPFNALAGTDYTLSPSKFALRSEPLSLFDFDVSGAERITAGRADAVVALSSGRVDAVVQWLRFRIGYGETYETLGEGVRAFGAQCHPVEPFDCAEGEEVRIHGAHDTLSSWFWITR